MKTHEVISIPESELVVALKTMSIEELERHAKQIVNDLGSGNYAGLMKKAMQTIEQSDASSNRFELVKNLIRDSLPNEAVMSDIYARLAAIIMMILSRRFSRIVSNRS